MLRDRVRDVALSEIERLRAFELPDYAQQNRDTLVLLHSNGILKISDIERAMERVASNTAKAEYNLLVGGDSARFADDGPDLNPNCLAHGISHYIFSPKELDRIPLESGSSLRDFYDTYNSPKLIGILRMRFLRAFLGRP